MKSLLLNITIMLLLSAIISCETTPNAGPPVLPLAEYEYVVIGSLDFAIPDTIGYSNPDAHYVLEKHLNEAFPTSRWYIVGGESAYDLQISSDDFKDEGKMMFRTFGPGMLQFNSSYPWTTAEFLYAIESGVRMALRK